MTSLRLPRALQFTWLAAFVIIGSTGCSTQVAWLLKMQPVTEERCKALSMFQLGLADGELNNPRGDRFFFWDKDCRGVGVRLDRAEYDRGYEQGQRVYCSCENGFLKGATDSTLELQGQYANCTRAQYKDFEAGFQIGTSVKVLKEDEARQRAPAACEELRSKN